MNYRDKRVEELAKNVLMNNRRSAKKGREIHGFTCPSPHLYHWQWLWDSCFHAIALRWFDPDFAKKELISLMSGQWADGRVPNMVHVGYNWRFDRLIHGTGRNTSGITQPPIIADAVLRVHETAPDVPFLEKMYEPLKKYYEWLRRWRETDNDGLIAVFHPWETGIDNSPRWDDVFNIENFSRKAFDITKGLVMFRFNFARYDNEKMKKVTPYIVKGIDMSCHYCANLNAMADLAEVLGKSGDADEFRKRAEITADSIQKKMWDGELKVFHDLVGLENRKSYVPTLFSFMPVWAGVATKEQAELAHAEIRDEKKYWSEFPVPTTAMDYKAFDENGYWRGTVWINTNWFMVEGMSMEGYSETANIIKEKTLDLVSASGMREYYNPFTGAGLGAESFAWSSLALDLLKREF